MKTGVALLFLASIVQLVHASAHAADPIPTHAAAHGAVPRIEVRSGHLHTREILGASAADVELGPTPPLGASRIVERAEIERAYAAAGVAAPRKIPLAIRVARKTQKLAPADVGGAIRDALGKTRLPRGAALGAIRAAATEVAADFDHVTVELPPVPRRAGTFFANAQVTFVDASGEPGPKTFVPIELVLPPEASVAEIPKGAPIALVVRKGLVEVSIAGVAGSDADVGGVLPVVLRPSGRVLRARAVDRDHALALEDGT